MVTVFQFHLANGKRSIVDFRHAWQIPVMLISWRPKKISSLLLETPQSKSGIFDGSFTSYDPLVPTPASESFRLSVNPWFKLSVSKPMITKTDGDFGATIIIMEFGMGMKNLLKTLQQRLILLWTRYSWAVRWNRIKWYSGWKIQLCARCKPSMWCAWRRLMHAIRSWDLFSHQLWFTIHDK